MVTIVIVTLFYHVTTLIVNSLLAEILRWTPASLPPTITPPGRLNGQRTVGFKKTLGSRRTSSPDSTGFARRVPGDGNLGPSAAFTTCLTSHGFLKQTLGQRRQSALRLWGCQRFSRWSPRGKAIARQKLLSLPSPRAAGGRIAILVGCAVSVAGSR